MRNFLVIQRNIFHMTRTWTASRIMHDRADRDHFHTLQGNPVVLHLLARIVDVVEPEFSRFERLAGCRCFEEIRRSTIELFSELKG